MKTYEMVFYHKGDKCQYTGKTILLHGGLFHEFYYLEGHKKGKFEVTLREPKKLEILA